MLRRAGARDHVTWRAAIAGSIVFAERYSASWNKAIVDSKLLALGAYLILLSIPDPKPRQFIQSVDTR